MHGGSFDSEDASNLLVLEDIPIEYTILKYTKSRLLLQCLLLYEH